MDIHFCDLCGVRVTDVDLRGGHGIRKHYDVICATCLELGHGKEWLARHQRGKSATAAAQPVAQPAAALAAAVSSKQSPVITQARDRVRTYEDGDGSPVVAPQVLAAEEPEDSIATSEMEANAVAAEAARLAAPESNPFAAAASSFSALAQPAASKPTVGTDVDENVAQGEGLSDESTAAPILADDQGEEKADEKADGDSPFDYQADTGDGNAQKDETLPSDREPLMAEKPVDKGRQTPSSASFAKVGSKSGTGNAKVSSTKGSKARSGKAPLKKPVNKNKNILIMTALSIGILTMIMLITIGALKKPAKQQERIEFDMSQDLKDAIKDAKLSATLALKSKNIDEMKAARSKIQAIQPKIYQFSDEAKAQNKDAWDDEAFGRYLEVVDWPDTQLMIRNLNDEIVKQGNGGTGRGPER
jgi:hypothetical protein